MASLPPCVSSPTLKRFSNPRSGWPSLAAQNRTCLLLNSLRRLLASFSHLYSPCRSLGTDDAHSLAHHSQMAPLQIGSSLPASLLPWACRKIGGCATWALKRALPIAMATDVSPRSQLWT